MRRLCVGVLLLSIIALLSLSASGQDVPTAEVFGGYSYLHVDTQGRNATTLNNECNIVFGGSCPFTLGIHPGFNGWNIAPQVNINRWFGVKAQISGQYGNILSIKFNTQPPLTAFRFPGQHIFDFLFGPVISHRSERYTAFGQGLLGVQHAGLSGNIPVAGFSFAGPSKTDFAIALGGGLDLKASKRFALPNSIMNW